MKKLFLFVFLLLSVRVASAQSHAATLSWSASSSTGVTGYNVYRAPCIGTITAGVCSAEGAFAKLTATAVSGLTYQDTTVAAGTAYAWYVTAFCSTCSPSESGPSNHFAVTTPNNQPLPPTNLTITNITRNQTGVNTTIVAGWQDAPNVNTTYKVISSGNVMATGIQNNITGIYSLTWNGKVKAGVPITFQVCDANGCVNSVV